MAATSSDAASATVRLRRDKR